MSKENKNVIYYVLGFTALATGIYYLSSKDEVKNYFSYLKNLIKLNKKDKNDE
jgi:hypothetical protein